tara:strand:+ start:9694 stop:11121 length:1428 start_codon:yes stop_codon:yes gene_type:complete
LGLRILHLHLHGLFRSSNLELGRDSDTGGQTLYVLELIKGLASKAEVDQVDLVTRLISDDSVSSDYSQEEEFIVPGAKILRFPFGPYGYLRKELLWPFLDQLVSQLVEYYKDPLLKPDWIHAHYADAGYVGSQLSKKLNIPLVFTGHSLGREKNRRLQEIGLSSEQIEKIYFINRRISAEEIVLRDAEVVITSTNQESTVQYSDYFNFSSDKVSIIPPGVDSSKFHHVHTTTETSSVDRMLSPFLRNIDLPPLLAISRAVRRKNITGLIEEFGKSKDLQNKYNLILILGCRSSVKDLDDQQQEIFSQIFHLIDKFNLYGKIAIPKQHKPEHIPAIYRWSASRSGFFVNPALTEPFGLTLLEAASCGLPMVATNDGGPREILARCENGKLVDVTNPGELRTVLENIGDDHQQWRRWSNNGIEAVSRHFGWDAHVRNYLSIMCRKLQDLKESSSSGINVSCLKGPSSLIKPQSVKIS